MLHPICERLIEIRRKRYGERGKSAFARDLGIPVTSYVHYENGRLPPADLLVKIAQVGEVSLDWLLTGDGADISLMSQTGRQTSDRKGNPSPRPAMGTENALIPIVGSTAAGYARFWNELETTHGGPEADARLETVLEQYQTQNIWEGEARDSGNTAVDSEVALVQYSRPDEQGFLEFLQAEQFKRRYPRAVAWRIDGDSMAPRYEDGDLVLTSSDHPAVEVHPCVARQRGQIGVNCKLYRREGDDVLLIPINPGHAPQRVPANQIQWAFRVLGSVRLG